MPLKNHQEQLEYLRQWRISHKGYARQKSNQWAKEHPDLEAQQLKRYRHKHPEQAKVHRDLNRNKLAFPVGEICSRCGSSELLHRHHPDYSKPELYETVCASCHGKITKGLIK